MSRVRHLLRVSGPLLLISGVVALFPGAANATVFPCLGAPNCPILIEDNPDVALGNHPATPYPSNIVLSGLTGMIVKLNVTLTGYNHTFPDDADVLLVGPTGAAVELMSDAGAGTDAAADLTFDDAAGGSLPDGAGVVTGTYKPSNFATIDPPCNVEAMPNTDPFPAPAPPPGAGYSQTLSTFNGTNPNGTWKLYITDDCNQDGGSLTSWSLDIQGPTGVTLVAFEARARSSTVEVRWRSVVEAGILGYNVFRTTAARTIRVNRSLIAARGLGQAGATYRFVDRTARSGRFTYRLQVVGQDGSRRWYGRAVVRARR